MRDSDDSQHNYVVINPTFSNVTQEYANYDPKLDTLLNEAPDVETNPGLSLDPLVFGTGDDRLLSVTGTKTDSLGETDFPGGTDRIQIWPEFTGQQSSKKTDIGRPPRGRTTR